MDLIAVKKVCEKHKDLVDTYFENEGKKLYSMIDKILFKLKFDVEKSDFYSLGSEIFLDALCRYDETQDFNGFLYSCLMNKFKTEMTRRGRNKRCCKIIVEENDNGEVTYVEKIIRDDSLNREISSSRHSKDISENYTLGDMIADKKTVESEIFEEKEDGYSKEMCKYLSRLSNLQMKVLHLISIGFMPSEILEELHINQKMYEDCYNAIHSYRNTAVLM